MIVTPSKTFESLIWLLNLPWMQPLGRMMIIIPLRRKMDGNLGMFFAALFIMKGKNRTGLDLFRMAMDETQHGFWFTRDTTPSILPFSSYSAQQRCARSTWTENRKKVINGFELAQAPTAHIRGSHQTFKGKYRGWFEDQTYLGFTLILAVPMEQTKFKVCNYPYLYLKVLLCIQLAENPVGIW